MQIKLKHNIALIVIILFLTIINNIASAQTRISSPYSRYKLGTSQKNLFAQNLGLGLTSGIRNEATVNFGNPASYTSFDTTSFVFDVGLNNYFNILQNSVTKQKYNYTSLGYLLFGFPVTKWWGSSFGLTPFSKTGYKMSFSQYIDSLGNVNYIYEGNGGINRFYWGNGFKIIKNISVGVNASFLFGSLDKIRSIIFIDSTKIYNVRIKNSTIISDIVFNWGIQYYTFIKPDLKLTLGSSFNTNSNLNAKQNIIVQRFLSNNTGYEIIKDTVANNTKQKGKILLPAEIKIGFTLQNKENYIGGIDFEWQNWSKFKNFEIKDSLKNSLQANIGFAFIPSRTSISTYFQKIQYRLGAYYEQTGLKLKNTQIIDFGIRFGMGLPLKRSKSKINIGFELGQTGTIKNNLIKEQYCKVIIGLGIWERWFIRTKYE